MTNHSPCFLQNKNEKIMLFVPAYNCEKQIVRVLGQINHDVLSYVNEIVIINNRSTDNTENVAVEFCKNNKKLPVRILRNDCNYGLGGSHKVAFQYAIEHNYDYVIVLHGDDQGRISDFIPLLQSGLYRNYDCCLGARFMKGAQLIGYDKLRIWGNYGFNFLFSLVVRKKIYDLGSGLNMYKVDMLKTIDFSKYPDTLYFNDLMILSSCFYKHKMIFSPISWREEDQVSNNKLLKFSIALIKMLFNYSVKKNLMSRETHNN